MLDILRCTNVLEFAFFQYHFQLVVMPLLTVSVIL